MEKNKSVNIFIVCSVLILIVLFSILYKVFDDDGCLLVKSTSEIDVDDKNPENESQIKEEDEKKARIENIKNNLKNSLPSANEYLLLNGSDKTIEEFVEWFAGKFGDEIILKLDNSNINEANRQQDLLSPKNESDGSAIEEIEIERKIYESTGETLLILLDEFMGIKDYDTMPCKEDGIHITFAGDICLAEDGFVLDYYDTVAGLSECISPAIIHQTSTADIFMLNNEFSISDRGTPLYGKMYTFRAMPQRTQLLNELGADIVSLANNHVYDFGEEAFCDTIENIQNAGIKYVGGGNDITEAEKIIYVESAGLKIGFISASRAEKYRFTPGATQSSPGIFLMYEPERFLEIAADAAKRCDYLIAYVHWGTEDSKYYEEYQHDLAVRMFDAGIDAIIGAHPHVLQGMEYINGKPVIYSLGDFWFNNETKYTALLNIILDYNGLKEMTVTPCIQSHYTTSLIENEEEKAAFFRYIRELSNNCNVTDNGEITDSD